MPIAKHLRHLYKTDQWFEAREKIKARAEDRCERCSAKNGSWIVRDSTRRGYTTITAKDAAALKARGELVVLIQCGCCHRYPVPPMDYEPCNLMWLCRGCHLRNDRPLHRRSRATRKDLARPLLAGAVA